MKLRSFALLILGMLLLGSPAGAAGPTVPTTAASKYEAEKAIQGVPVSKDTWMRRATERASVPLLNGPESRIPSETIPCGPC